MVTADEAVTKYRRELAGAVLRWLTVAVSTRPPM
jgi:hypothetical protein